MTHNNQVGPHGFEPRIVRKGFLRRTVTVICARCYLPPEYHGIETWVTARPLGDDDPVFRYFSGDGKRVALRNQEPTP